MTLKEILKKKEKIKEDVTPSVVSPPEPDPIAEGFTFLRSDTNTEELIKPPSFTSDAAEPTPHTTQHRLSSHLSRLRSSSNASTRSAQSRTSPKSEKRLSQRLHLNRSRTPSSSSVHVPTDLPEIQDFAVQGEDKEAQWEERATMLAKGNPNHRPTRMSPENGRPSGVTSEHKFYQGRSPQEIPSQPEQGLSLRAGVTRSVSSAKADENIQEAIRLHESGDLINSTAMFGRLADSSAMAQIMFGLALRHGWGVPANPPLAIQYLSAAASSSASVESAALHSGMKKGGAAKGELVLAIYELANSFRHGWGVKKDTVAARKYYETAANLGDADAMNEVARCYESGQGGPKDRVSPDFLFTPQIRRLEKSRLWGNDFEFPLDRSGNFFLTTSLLSGGLPDWLWRKRLRSPTIPEISVASIRPSLCCPIFHARLPPQLYHITSHHIISHQASAHPANLHPVYSSAILPSCRTEWIQNPWKQLVSRPLLCIPIPSSVYSSSRRISPNLAFPCLSCGPVTHSGCWVALFHPQNSYVGRLVRTLQDLFLPKHNLLQREASVCHGFPTEQSITDNVEIKRTRNSPMSESIMIGTKVKLLILGSRLMVLFWPGYGKTSITQNRRVRVRSTRVT